MNSQTTILKNELVDRSKAGDARAQRELYETYAGAMYNLAVRMLNDTAEAQDVLQDSFISAFQNLEKFKKEATFGAWLKRIVINKSINALKKRKNDLVPLPDDVVEEVDDQEVTYDVSTVNEAVKQLPDGYRLIVTLFLFEGYSHQEIADQLNISEGTSKSQYSRGKKRLIAIVKHLNETK